MTDVIKANGWKVFMVLVAVVTALGSHLGAFPWLPVWAQHAIELCSFVASVILAVLIDPTKVTPPPTLSEMRNSSTKLGVWMIGAVLGASVLVSSCAGLTSRLPHLPDGSLDVRQLVTWASDGVEVDCQFAATSSFCIFGRDAVADARAAMDHNPTARQAAAKRSLADSLTKWPVIAPWFSWLTGDLSAAGDQQ